MGATISTAVVVGREGGFGGLGMRVRMGGGREVIVAILRKFCMQSGWVGGKERRRAGSDGAAGSVVQGFDTLGPIALLVRRAVVAHLVDVPALVLVLGLRFEVAPRWRCLGLLCKEVLFAVFVAHEGFDTAGHVDTVGSGGGGDEGIEGVARVEWYVWGVRVARHHIGEGEARVVVVHVPAARETFRRGEAALEVFCGLKRDLTDLFFWVTGFCRGLEGFGYHVEIVPCSFGMLNGLLGCGVSICLASVRTRTAPGTLTGCEDTVDHIDPIEEGIDDKHDRVQPYFEPS